MSREPGEGALHQLADLFGKLLEREVSVSGNSFRSEEASEARQGVLSFQGRLTEAGEIEIRVELARVSPDARGSYASVFELLSGLDGKVQICEPSECGSGCLSLAIQFHGRASPLTLQRETVLQGLLKKLDELARRLQRELPVPPRTSELEELYKPVESTVMPIYPATDQELASGSARALWALEVHDYLASGCSVALAAPTPIVQDFALAILAHAAPGFATSLGRVVGPALNPRALLELLKVAPGTLAVQAAQLSAGANVYEVGSEIQTLLNALTHVQRGVLFFGHPEELRRVFRGGQGSAHSPRHPIVVHPPAADLDVTIAFALRDRARPAGGLPQRQGAELATWIQDALASVQPERRLELLPSVASRSAVAATSGRSISPESTADFVARIDALSETLGGVSRGAASKRAVDVQHRFMQGLTDSELFELFSRDLLGQDRALRELAERLCTEILTRPLHQPLRYCAIGPPGSGKSESAQLLAQRLGVPFINIDAASMSDFHTASAQLLGSGRGIVGSHEAGRLEEAAQHHTGAVIEVSDLDHAAPDVRSHLADLFLQVLETGEVQTATGAMVSCASLVFAFTMNVPTGNDAGLCRSIGFGDAPSLHEVSQRVVAETRKMISSAFLSRVGSPILFDPLTGPALVEIAVCAVERSLSSALTRMGMEPAGILVSPAVGEAVVAAVEVNLATFGARALVEKARSLLAGALLKVIHRRADLTGKQLQISAVPDGTLVLHTLQERDSWER